MRAFTKMPMSNPRPQAPDSAMTGTALESVQKPAGGPCTECGYPTERWDAANGDFCCEDCCERIVRGQERDQCLDDPRHGQAAELNRRR